MSTLQTILEDPARRTRIVKDCVDLVDSEVAAKGGLSGLAVKAPYAVVKALKPGIVTEMVDKLLDEFVATLEPLYAEHRAAPTGTLSSFLNARASAVANALLGVTDRRAQGATHETLRKDYDKLRPTAVKHVEQAVPGIARVLEKNAP